MSHRLNRNVFMVKVNTKALGVLKKCLHGEVDMQGGVF